MLLAVLNMIVSRRRRGAGCQSQLDAQTIRMVMMAPRRGLTLILIANGEGLARPFALSAGDITVSPFARLSLSIFVR